MAIMVRVVLDSFTSHPIQLSDEAPAWLHEAQAREKYYPPQRERSRFDWENELRLLDKIERKDQAFRYVLDNPREREQVELLFQELNENDLEARAARRVFEDMTADRLEGLARRTDLVREFKEAEKLMTKVERMRNCRRSGSVGARPDGGAIVAWDSKCGDSRLCPDEAREEANRISKIYTTAMMLWQAQHPKHRVFYAVITEENIPRGQLAQGKREQFLKLRQLLDKGYAHAPFTPLKRVYLNGRWHYVKVTKGEYFKAWDNLHGVLAVQEDPLSARGDWNVHTNLILCVKGEFDYAHFRHAWGKNVEIKEIPRKDKDALRRALMEVIKYSAKHTGMKSHEKHDDGEAAKGLLDWDDEALLEWVRAQNNFRRTRSYGVLYGVDGKRWDGSSEQTRAKWCACADVPETRSQRTWKRIESDTDAEHKTWTKERARIKKIMNSEHALDMDAIQWVGVVGFERGSYCVSCAGVPLEVALIQEDNFFSKGAHSGHKSPNGNQKTLTYGGH